MGVFLRACRSLRPLCRFPHARGGVSRRAGGLAVLAGVSPRPWGCFHDKPPGQDILCGFPTPVGVFLVGVLRLCQGIRFPHARGGVSTVRAVSMSSLPVSPRPWGCFYGSVFPVISSTGFPTPVGVFLEIKQKFHQLGGFPHARGGVSMRLFPSSSLKPVSPRPWGCFSIPPWNLRRVSGFPTPVGVFPFFSNSRYRACGFPHARGGVSSVDYHSRISWRSSPPSWGTVFGHTNAPFASSSSLSYPRIGEIVFWGRCHRKCIDTFFSP